MTATPKTPRPNRRTKTGAHSAEARAKRAGKIVRIERAAITIKVEGRPDLSGPIEHTEQPRLRVRIGGQAQSAAMLDDPEEQARLGIVFVSSQVLTATRENLLSIAANMRAMLGESWDNSGPLRAALRSAVRNIETATQGSEENERQEQPSRNRNRSGEIRTAARPKDASGSEAVRPTAGNLAPSGFAFGDWRNAASGQHQTSGKGKH